MEEDSINHPSHYTDGPIYRKPECIDLTRLLPFCAGNVIKYIWRAGHKGDWREDLAKARWYWNDRGFYVPRNDEYKDAKDIIAHFDLDCASMEWKLKIKLFKRIIEGYICNDSREELAALERYLEETEKSENTGDCK